MAEQTTNVIAIAAGGDQSLALWSNGTVTNWGGSPASGNQG
jgi:alpha-tubulin suppressor-like RCC1 family protein